MIALNIVIIVWMLASPDGYDGTMRFVTLQLFVNAVLVIEVITRMFVQRERFWKDCSNRFDFFVMTFSIAAQLLYIHDPKEEEWGDVASLFFRIFRDGFLFFRLIVFIKNRKKSRLPSENVDFSTIEEDTTPLMQSEDDN